MEGTANKVKCNVDDIPWAPHPVAKMVTVKKFIARSEEGAGVTCMTVLISKGAEVPEHIHEDEDDILFPLKGKAVMSIEGEGTFSLEPGIIVRVPKGTKHKIGEVTEELLLFDVFAPTVD